MSDTERNPIRDAMLRQAILQADFDPSLATVSTWLPGDFGLDEAELSEMLATMADQNSPPRPSVGEQSSDANTRGELGAAGNPDIEFEGAPEPSPASTGAAATLVDAEPVKESPTLTFQEARAVVVDWGNKLSAARGRLMSAQARQQAGRLKLAAAIGQFVAGFPKLTREGLQRQYLASEAERRQRVADGLEPPTGGTRQVPTGALTRGAFYRRGGGINQGHGNKHIKKAASLVAQQLAAGLKPAVGVPKLPSQR